MTDTALEGIRAEAEKAGMTLSDALSTCCARGWQGFKAKWLDDQFSGVRAASPDWTQAAT